MGRIAPVLVLLIASSLACTTIVVGKSATKDGSTMSSHSDDGETDPRFVLVPAADHAPGSLRNVYYDTEQYPRYVGYDRGPAYWPKHGQTPSVPIGTIPQVNHTYKHFEATYGVMNEMQVGMGESTCSGVFSARAIGYGGKALLSIDELSRIGLERCASSRCAVLTMGSLAEQYGFYGVTGGIEGGSESLMVHDPEEAFIFHILPDDTGTSAIWAAQRVPDNHYGVVANMFVIRGVNTSDSFNFLASSNLHSIAQAHGWWNSSMGLLDFTATYSDGEYAHLYYSGRRMWGASQLLAPSARLPDTYTNLRYDLVYPATLPPDALLTPQDLMAVHRWYYQGTKYDQTQGLAAGPWGNPDRWGQPWDWKPIPGNWERTLGIYRTAYTHITQARSWLPPLQGGIMWFAPAQSAPSIFTPFSVAITSMAPSFMTGDPSNLSRDSAYWGARYVFNLCKFKYQYMMAVVRITQAQRESTGASLVAYLDAHPAADPTAAYLAHAANVSLSLWALPDALINQFADGYNTPYYPDWWLDAVGYQYGPPPPPLV